MLKPEYPASVQTGVSGLTDALPSPSETFESALGFVRRQYPVLVFAVGLAIAMGFLYVFTTPPSYTATASMLIDSKRVQLFQQQSMFSDLPVDASMVESQVEILKSETVALAVIKKLHLAEDPEFIHPNGGLIGTLLGFVTGLFSFSSGEPDLSSDFRTLRSAVHAFQSRLYIRRIGLTYVITIGFRSLSADRAAEVANEVANAYIDDQLEAKYQAARRAGTWLQSRLRELREQASTAERVVVAFKNKNGMIDAGGRSINEQQLAELNSELVLARSKTAEAKAKLDRVQAVLLSNEPNAAVLATVADTLKSEVITKLRSQYLELARREADWVPRYGYDHLAVVNVRNQMRELQTSIKDELQRIAETYKSDLEISQQHEGSVQTQLDQAVAQSQVTNQAQVALRELESDAQTYRALYDNFLQRYMQSVQQQSFPITDARVISAATRPLSKSSPRTTLLLGLAAMVGLAFGAVAAAWRDFADRVFRTSAQVEAILQTECIALVPAVNDEMGEAKITDLGRKFKRKREVKPIVPGRGTQIAGNTKSMAAGYPTITPVANSLYSAILDSPFSAFAESIRSVKVAIDLSPTAKGGRIIGFTSSVPNEGKSSVATAVARLTAHTGARTLLVDCDLKNPSLSRLLSPKAKCGLLEVVRGQATLEEAIWVDSATNMRFLPATTKARIAHSSEVLAAAQTRKLFDSFRSNYDYIIADFAPLMPIVDVRASTNLVDGYIFVVAWGQTRIDFVEQSLHSARGVYEQLLGAVLNKVDLTRVGRYDGRGGYYDHENYRRYGYSG